MSSDGRSPGEWFLLNFARSLLVFAIVVGGIAVLQAGVTSDKSGLTDRLPVVDADTFNPIAASATRTAATTTMRVSLDAVSVHRRRRKPWLAARKKPLPHGIQYFGFMVTGTASALTLA